MSSGADRRFALTLVLALLGSQVARQLGVESLCYAVALVLAGICVLLRSSETPWIGFFLLAVTSQIYPVQIDELGGSLRGTFRPYILAVAVVAGSLLVGLWLRPGRTHGRAVRSVWGRTVAFAGIMFLALAYGYFTSVTTPGLLDILRECSGWITFLFFTFLGYRLSPSSAETQRAFAKLRLSVLAYSAFFVVRFIQLSLSFGANQTGAEFGYSQRDMVFFSGLVLVLVIAQSLTSGVNYSWRETWSAGLILLFAILFSGARSVFACVLIVTLLFVIVWRSKIRLRMMLLGMAAMLVMLFGPSLSLSSQQDSQGGSLLSYVSSRFLGTSTEDTSLLARASEMVAVADAVRENPLLGKGALASYSFFDPLFGWNETTFVDSGLGYLLMKTGLLGTVIFIWFAVGWLKMARGLQRATPVIALTPLASFIFYLVYLPFGPSFFEFQHSWFIGLVVGQTILLASSFPIVRAARVPGVLGQPGALT